MRRWIIILTFLFSLTGCTYYAPPGENHASRVVEQIDVTATVNSQLHRYRYTDEKKMRTILEYLRRLDPDLSTVITPDTFRTDAYQIVLTLSDGTQTVYHQIYDTYLQVNNGPWRSIDEIQGSMLQPLLLSMPSDAL